MWKMLGSENVSEQVKEAFEKESGEEFKQVFRYVEKAETFRDVFFQVNRYKNDSTYEENLKVTCFYIKGVEGDTITSAVSAAGATQTTGTSQTEGDVQTEGKAQAEGEVQTKAESQNEGKTQAEEEAQNNEGNEAAKEEAQNNEGNGTAKDNSKKEEPLSDMTKWESADIQKNGCIVTDLNALKDDLQKFKKFGVPFFRNVSENLYYAIMENYKAMVTESVNPEDGTRLSDLIEQVKSYCGGDDKFIGNGLCYIPVKDFDSIAEDCDYNTYEMRELRALLSNKGYIKNSDNRYTIDYILGE